VGEHNADADADADAGLRTPAAAEALITGDESWEEGVEGVYAWECGCSGGGEETETAVGVVAADAEPDA
jgi:hypothetical protein